MEKLKAGLIGCGDISAMYLKNLSETFKNVQVVAVADIKEEAAAHTARQFGIPLACTNAQLLALPDISLVINLTVPQAHAETCLAILNAGKHVYVEKTLAVTLAEAQAILALAKQKNLLVGCAPDTFLGAGIQTCRSLIESGAIGLPTMALGLMASRGPENWHPNPAFLYGPGAGPLFDMGPYYLTAMLELLGGVTRVSGTAQTPFATRTIASQPLCGQKITVQAPTTVAATLDFACGAVGTLVTTFDSIGYLPRLEIFGTEGSLTVPDPNYFAGPVWLKTPNDEIGREMPLVNPYTANCRGLGVSNMAQAILHGGAHRATGARAYEVLRIMHGIYTSSKEGRQVML